MTTTTTQKILAGAIGLAMVISSVAGIAVSLANAQVAASFSRNLTVGSTGADVTALQTILNSKGYLTVAPTGYFGSLTKAAVMAWQAAVGLPSTGFFGPLSRAAVGGSSTGTSMVPGCSAGAMFSSTTGQPCSTGTSTVPGCSAGAMFSSTTGQPCSGTTSPGTGGSTSAAWTPDGTNGSVTASYSPIVSSSQTLNEGQTANMYAVKLQAVAGKVDLNRFDVYFSDRAWLDFSQLTLSDSNGNVIATLTPTPSTVTEVTVGSSYLVRFTGFNYVIPSGSTATLVVGGTVVSNSTHITSGSPVISVTVPTTAVQTINGLGYSNTTGVSNTNTVTLSSTGSTANILSRVSPSSPAQRIVTTTSNQTTPNVVLGVFSLQSQNNTANLNGLSVNINTTNAAGTAPGPAVASVFQNLRLIDSATNSTYGANSVGSTTTFTNLSINLPTNTWKDLTLEADVLQNVSGVQSTSSLALASNDTTNIVAVDQNYNTPTVTANTSSSNGVTFLTSGVSVSNESSGFTPTNGANGVTQGGTATFSFTLTNTGNTDVFISKVPAVALATSTTGSVGSPASASSTLTFVTASPTNYAGDTGTAPSSGAYDIPAGTSRTFTYTGTLDDTGGTSGLRVFSITQINFGTAAATPTGSNVNFGLGSLVISTSLHS